MAGVSFLLSWLFSYSGRRGPGLSRQPDAVAPRRLLLVGEGNFSFAVALSETLDPNTSLTATCPQLSADLARDLVVRENLRRLRERGSEAQPSTKPRPAVAPPH